MATGYEVGDGITERRSPRLSVVTRVAVVVVTLERGGRVGGAKVEGEYADAAVTTADALVGIVGGEMGRTAEDAISIVRAVGGNTVGLG